MSDDEKAIAEKAEVDQMAKAKRGHFESELEEYPGFFELPHPFLDRHMKVWWKLAINPVAILSEFDYEFYDCEWKALTQLIKDYGKWSVDNVPKGDLENDNMPSIVKAWAMMVASVYIYPKLPPNMQRKRLGIM